MPPISLKPIMYEDQNPTGLAVRTRHVTIEMKAPLVPRQTDTYKVQLE